MERFHAAIARMMEEKEFKSIKEANAFLATMNGRPDLPDSRPRTPLEAAQQIMYAAWDEPSKKKRIALARRAIEVSADCADAYVLLAEETAVTNLEKMALYENGVQAGERALGPGAFAEHLGHFWGVVETRPYMRSRAGLAECLWHAGRRDEAAGHYHEMLRLNTGDNQGVRYALLDLFLETGKVREARDLIDQFPDDAASAWMYSKALLKFMREGSNPKTDKRLINALDQNPYVPLYLLGIKQLPKRLPETIGVGDELEAVDYVAGSMPVWHETPGALEWLARVFFILAGPEDNKPAS
jgi:tetratricopeptide (TPR) repeat protein